MVMNGSFNGYNRQIPSRDKPGRPIEQLLFFTFCPKPPNLSPKIGPKSSKWLVLPCNWYNWFLFVMIASEGAPKYLGALNKLRVT